MDATDVERALRAIVPSASPAQLMDAVVQHAVAASRADPHRKRRRATRRHGAYVRKRELEQSRLYNLPLDVIDLQRQIAQLEQLRAMLEARALNARDAGDGSLVKTAAVYYDVMARGFQDVVATAAARIDTRAYLAAAMGDDVRIGRFCGRRHFVPMMQRYTACFADSRLALTSARVVAATSGVVIVRTTGQYSGRLTPRTLEALFPHVAPRKSDLAARLLARPLEGESTFDFVFDRASGRVARFDADMNFVPAFVKLVPDPTQLAFLFSQARISEEMFIGELDEFDDAPVSPCMTDEDDETSGSSATATSSDSEDGSRTKSPLPPAKRSLKMADLLSPDFDDTTSAVRLPSLYA